MVLEDVDRRMADKLILKRATREEVNNSKYFTAQEKKKILNNFESEKKWGL